MPYRLPAEWEPHEGTWLAWPHNKSHWPGKFKPIPPVFAKIAAALAKSEPVFICVKNSAMASSAAKFIGKTDNIFFQQIATNASWSRDHGPIFVYDDKGNRVITDWIFNNWGGKYRGWRNDDLVPQKIAKIFKIPAIEPGIVLEGGSIDVNGLGALLTTEQCLLNKNRNPKLNRRQIQNYLKKYLGATKILWLKEGIIGDDTDGHIDDLARFINPTTVLCAVEDNTRDANYAILKKNYQDLKKMSDQAGRPFKIIKLPMPDPVIYKNQRLPASYANFYIANKAVLVPTFRCPKDRLVLKIFKPLFPNRKIIGIDCVDLVWGLGTIHCSTQQQPK